MATTSGQPMPMAESRCHSSTMPMINPRNGSTTDRNITICWNNGMRCSCWLGLSEFSAAQVRAGVIRSTSASPFATTNTSRASVVIIGAADKGPTAHIIAIMCPADSRDSRDASDSHPRDMDRDIDVAKVDHPRIERAVREILLAIGENPEREGLLKTPSRVARAYAELMAGLHDDPRRHLKTVFRERYDEVVLLRDIEFHSLCEHHLPPFTGRE